MISKNTNKNGVKLLTALAIMAVMLAGAFCVISDSSDAATESTELTVVAGDEFLRDAINDDGQLKGDYKLSSTVYLAEDLTLDLNGHSITAEGIDVFVVGGNNVNVSIEDTSNARSGSIITTGENRSVIFVKSEVKPGDLAIDGGTYGGDYAIVWKGNGTNTISIQDAVVNAETAGMWFSYEPIEKATVSNTTVTSGGVGIYFATCKTAKLIESDVTAERESAVEVKEGDVEIKSCNIESKKYVDSNMVAYSGSGGAVSAITINNAYGTSAINVTIDPDVEKGKMSKITTVAGKSPVVATIDDDKPQSIEVVWQDHTSDVKLVYISEKGNVDQDFGGIITVNGIKYVSDSTRLGNQKEVSLCGDVTIGSLEKFDVNLNGFELTVSEGSMISGTVEGKGGAKAIFEKYKVPVGCKMVLSSGSIVIESTGEVVGINGTGTVTIKGDAKVVGDTAINGNIILEGGAKLTVPEGTSLKAKSITKGVGATAQVIVGGKLDIETEGTENGTPTVKVSNGAEVSGVNPSAIEYNAGTGEFEFGDTLNSDHTVTKNEYLSSTLTIPEGVTLTIANGGVLNLNGSDLKVYGGLVIESGATISAAKGTENIVMMKGCSIINNGIIGIGTQKVTIEAGSIDGKIQGAGSVSMTDVVGVSFDLVNTGKTDGIAGGAIYSLTVSGDIVSEGDNSKILIAGARIVGDLTIGEGVKAEIDNSAGVCMMSGTTVTVDGELSTNGDLKMKNKSTLVVNGVLNGKVIAETADYQATGSYVDGTTEFSLGHDSNAKITSFELSVGTSNFSKMINGVSTDFIAQRLYIKGSFDWMVITEDDDGYNGEIRTETTMIGVNEKFVNTIIASGSELTLDKGMVMKSTTSLIQVDGKMIIPQGALICDSGFVGTQYRITVTAPSKVTTTYIAPFADVLPIIDTVDKKTIDVREDVSVETEITVNEGQTIVNHGTLTISESGKVTVNAKGAIKENGVKTVEGTLIIMKGATCNAPEEYASKVSNADYTKYTGIASAMDGLQSGDVVEINGSGTIKTKDLSVPAGVTVNISKNVEITGNLTVPADAKVVVKDSSEIKVSGEKSKVTVNGTFDVTDGTLSMDGEKASLQSEGTTVLKAANLATLATAEKVNAFVYTDEDNNKVLTNLTDATKNAAAQDINNKSVEAYGTVNVSVVDLTTNLIVTGGSKMVADTINLGSKRSITVAEGAEFTGKVSAETGADAESIVTLTKVSEIVVASASVTEDGASVKIMTIAGDSPKGAIEVTEGTVRTSEDMDFTGEGNTLTISDKAELISKEGTVKSEGDDVAGVIVNGKYTVEDDATLSIGFMEVYGTLSVGDENDNVTVLGKLFVYGTVAISTTEDKEGKLSVKGEVIVGSNTLGANGTISGAVDIDSSATAFIKVYAGADMSAAQVNFVGGETTANATVFYINDIEYMTVYTKGGVTIGTIGETFKVSGLDLSEIWWYTVDFTPVGNDTPINDVDALYTTAKAAKVSGTISAGVGLQIYIDGISVENYWVSASDSSGYYIPVGQHKVTIEVLSGYDGSNAVITFNGATVSNGGNITVSESGFVLTANGATPASTPVTPVQPVVSSDDDMGLTEYLLIVLVILAAILVVVVAIRMMRS